MTKTNIIPAPGYLVIEPKKKESTTASGIVLPDSHDDKPQEGTILAVGAAFTTDFGTKKEANNKVGDMVIYGGWNNKEYKDNGVNLLLVKFDDVMATIDSSKKSALESAKEMYEKALDKGLVNHVNSK